MFVVIKSFLSGRRQWLLFVKVRIPNVNSQAILSLCLNFDNQILILRAASSVTILLTINLGPVVQR